VLLKKQLQVENLNRMLWMARPYAQARLKNLLRHHEKCPHPPPLAHADAPGQPPPHETFSPDPFPIPPITERILFVSSDLHTGQANFLVELS
jgi:hypothetical protein